MARAEGVKQDLQRFYADEAAERGSEEWLRRGGSARVPESRAAQYFIDRKVEEAIALTGLAPERSVLEVGSSFGHMTFLLAQRFREVVGVDLSAESIELARRRARRYGVGNVRFEVADAEDLASFGDGTFGGVFSFSTIRFCPRPERAIAEMFRVVAPGGAVAVDVPNRYCPWYGSVKRLFGIDPHIHDRLFSANEIDLMMERAGFVNVRHRHILFTTKRVPDATLPVFRALDRVLESTPGVRRLSGIVMTAGEKKDGERAPHLGA